MRAWLVLLLLLTPVVAAHGEAHGQSMPRQFATQTSVDIGNSSTVTVLYQSVTGQDQTFRAGDLFLLSGETVGPTVQVSLRATDAGGQVSQVAAWAFDEGDRQPKGVLLPGHAEYSLVIESASETPSSFTFLFDHTDLIEPGCTCGPRWIAQAPKGAAGVFTVDAEGGPYQAQLHEPAAHRMSVGVYEAKNEAAVFPEGFTLLAKSEDQLVHTLGWESEENRYYVVGQSLSVGFSGRDSPEGAPSPWHAVFEAGPDVSAGSPGLGPLPILLALVALVAIRSRR